jgi:glutamyl-tRNA synthetase
VLIPDFQKAGFLPEAVVNGLAFLGWNPGTTEEIFSLEALGTVFSLEKVNTAAAQYDFDKMLWFNSQWMRSLPAEKIRQYYLEFSGKTIEVSAIAVAREKAKTLVELSNELEYLIGDPGFDAERIFHKKMCPTPADAKKILSEILPMIEGIDEADFDEANIKAVSVTKIAELGLKNGPFLWPFRVALSNRPGSAGPFSIGAVIGKAATIKRLTRAMTAL